MTGAAAILNYGVGGTNDFWAGNAPFGEVEYYTPHGLEAPSVFCIDCPEWKYQEHMERHQSIPEEGSCRIWAESCQKQ